MLLSHPHAGWSAEPLRPQRALHPLPVTVALLALLFAAFHEVRAELAQAAGESLATAALTGTALLAIGSRTIGHALEAAFYSGWWRLQERPVRWTWMFCALVALSTFDTLAGATFRIAHTSQPWLFPVVGVRAIDGIFANAAGLRLAFGSIGLLSLLRVAGTALAQWQDGAPRRGAFQLTFAAWAAGRLVTWWTADLLRGLSPMG